MSSAAIFGLIYYGSSKVPEHQKQTCCINKGSGLKTQRKKKKAFNQIIMCIKYNHICMQPTFHIYKVKFNFLGKNRDLFKTDVSS